jgi:hypothetical protein
VPRWFLEQLLAVMNHMCSLTRGTPHPPTDPNDHAGAFCEWAWCLQYLLDNGWPPSPCPPDAEPEGGYPLCCGFWINRVLVWWCAWWRQLWMYHCAGMADDLFDLVLIIVYNFGKPVVTKQTIYLPPGSYQVPLPDDMPECFIVPDDEDCACS